ncbi:hypothetical protein Drorol1_Dr00005626, partial [Drosera rotundifolia]
GRNQKKKKEKRVQQCFHLFVQNDKNQFHIQFGPYLDEPFSQPRLLALFFFSFSIHPKKSKATGLCPFQFAANLQVHNLLDCVQLVLISSKKRSCCRRNQRESSPGSSSLTRMVILQTTTVCRFLKLLITYLGLKLSVNKQCWII